MKSYEIECGVCKNIFISTNNNRKYCSQSCVGKRARTDDEKNKIGKASAEKYNKNPRLRDISRQNGRKAMKFINENNLAFRMPPGYHTDEYKQYMREIMTGRKIDWVEKIKQSHWANKDEVKKNAIIQQILAKRALNESWNSEERRNLLANWTIENPDKCGSKFYKKGDYLSNKTFNTEYYASGFELQHMRILDDDDLVSYWTKSHGIKIDYIYNGVQRKYIPDFLIFRVDGSIELLELKGRVYEQSIIDTKCDAARKYCDKLGWQFNIIYQD